MQALWNSFVAFNQNGFSYLVYTISNNLWYLLIGAGAIACLVLYIKEEITVSVREEQQAL